MNDAVSCNLINKVLVTFCIQTKKDCERSHEITHSQNLCLCRQLEHHQERTLLRCFTGMCHDLH